jgi:hypothetical protein
VLLSSLYFLEVYGHINSFKRLIVNAVEYQSGIYTGNGNRAELCPLGDSEMKIGARKEFLSRINQIYY